MCVHIANNLVAKIDKNLKTNKLISKKEKGPYSDPFYFNIV